MKTKTQTTSQPIILKQIKDIIDDSIKTALVEQDKRFDKKLQIRFDESDKKMDKKFQKAREDQSKIMFEYFMTKDEFYTA